VPFATIVVAAIAVACIIGTILPQGNEVAEYLKHKPEARQTVELLGFLGLTRVYSSPWFIALLGLLSASLTACTYRRLRVAIDKTGRARGRAIGSVITHISLLLVLAGGVVRGVWGERGYLPLREGETKNVFFVGDDPKELPFSIRLVRFDVETYGSGDDRIKDYKSTLQVLEGSNVLVEKTIEVNLPLNYAGYTFYQSGFNPEDPEWTSLQVVKDPGVPLVYTGFGLMIAGLAAVFYLYPQKRPGSGTGDRKET